MVPTSNRQGVALKLEGRKDGRLLYAVTGQHFPKTYTSPVTLNEDAEVIGLFYKGQKLMDSVTLNVKVNKATGKKISVVQPLSTYFPGNGVFTLVDGIINEKGGRTNQSLGFQSDVDATIDLGTSQQISNVAVHALKSGGSYVYPPQSIEVSGSADGKTFNTLGNTSTVSETPGTKAIMKVDFAPAMTRYVRVSIKALPAVPAGQRGAGEKPWLFVDEIQVN
jgi:hexosaminidase